MTTVETPLTGWVVTENQTPVEQWIETAATRFWRNAGGEEPFPRTIEGSIPLALDVDVENIPRLRLSDVSRWLRSHQGQFPWRDEPWLEVRDRSLRGCLVAIDGSGCVFVDSHDPPDERRFTLAHEAAHFILDYLLPRERTRKRLGTSLLEVLDGERAATMTERIDAVLSGIDITPHVHMVERGPLGEYDGRVAEAESRADLLAIELLAPEERALTCLQLTGTLRHKVSRGAAALQTTFGLPATIATLYARRIVLAKDGGEGWQSWLLGDA